MKKIIIILIIIAIIIIAPLMMLINKYKAERNEVKKFNSQFEQYNNQKIYGTTIGSLINYAINNNKNYNIEKDENGTYIDDNKYCIRVEIKMPSVEENDKIINYSMETISYLGTERFVINFNLLEFKCEEITYNSYGRVSKLVFGLSE